RAINRTRLGAYHHAHEIKMVDPEVHDHRLAHVLMPSCTIGTGISHAFVEANRNRPESAEIRALYGLRGSLGCGEKTKVLIDHQNQPALTRELCECRAFFESWNERLFDEDMATER